MLYDRLRIFVSSKMQELAPERSTIKAALDALNVDAWVFEEDAGARPQSIRKTYLEELEAADLYIGLFWRGCGDYTIDEFEHASKLGKDCLIYEKRADIDGKRDPELQAFLDRISKVERGLTVRWFDTPEQLGQFVAQDAARWQTSIIRKYRDSNVRSNLSPIEAKDRRDLQTLLGKVQSFWIEGVLDRSIHGVGLMELGKETRPEAVKHPWEAVLELPFEGSRIVAPQQRIADVFEDVERSLLILGQPGSGKTTTLLELTRDLIKRAERDQDQPVPVVFHLSAWSEPQLIEWLESELSGKYQIPKSIGRCWLEQGRLLLLLDGLDEVGADQRDNCVEAINGFMSEYGMPGLVVCSRLQEYTALPKRLQLNGAVCLQPLSPDQIHAYVAEGGSQLAPLEAILQQHEPLRDLAKSPLMLSIMGLAYPDISSEALQGEQFATLEGCRNHLFSTYIDRMFQRRGWGEQPYSRSQTTSWLSWLAERMAEAQESIFLIEDLQPSWLSSGLRRAAYLVGFSITFGWLFALVMLLYWWGTTPIFFIAARVGIDASTESLAIWLLIQCPLWVLAVGVLDNFLPHSFGGATASWWGATRQAIVKSMVYLLCWMVWPMAFCDLSSHRELLMAQMLTGVCAALLMGVMGRRRRVTLDIQAVEAVGWSIPRALRGGCLGLLGGVGIYLTYLLGWPRVASTEIEAVVGFGYAVLGAEVGAIFGGFAPRIVEGKTVPNQGTLMSGRNALIAGLASSIVFGLTHFTFFLIWWQKLPEERRIELDPHYYRMLCYPLGVGMLGFLIAATWFGGLDAIKHYLLRLVLIVTGQIPRDFAGFLNYATRLNFVQRVGGGYMFVHRLLLEHFCAASDDNVVEVRQ